MRRGAALWLAFGALFALACNLTIPQATPTIAPSRTPSQTPILQPSGTPTFTQTPTVVALLPSATLTPPASATPVPSRTPSATPSATSSVTMTASPSPSPSSTSSATLTPSSTSSATATRTPSPPPTSTPRPTIVPTVTPLPTLGPTRTPSPTPSTSPTARPSATPLPAPSSTPAAFAPIGERPTDLPPATLDVTPVLVTERPGELPADFTPIAPTFTALPLVLTSFPTQPPVIAQTAQQIPTPLALPPPAVLPGSLPNLAFTLDTTGGFSGSIVDMPGGTVTLASDPNNPNHIALVDSRGLLFVYSDFAGRQGARIESSPFSFPEPQNAETNQARVVQVAYAPNSAWVAFLVDTDSDALGDNDSSNDGVYVLPVDSVSGQVIGGSVMLLRDCPPEPGCVIVNRPDAPYRYRSQNFAWSPSADALLIELELPEEGRRGITLVYPAVGAATSATRPPVLRYDYGSWSNDGERLVVSGRDPDGRIVVGTINREGGDPQLVDVASLGLGWVQNAVQRPDGEIVMLGSASGGGSPMRLYTSDGAALTGDIGSAPPVRVTWSPDRSAALVVTVENGISEYWIAFTSGDVRRITADIGGALAVEWLNR